MPTYKLGCFIHRARFVKFRLSYSKYFQSKSKRDSSLESSLRKRLIAVRTKIGEGLHWRNIFEFNRIKSIEDLLNHNRMLIDVPFFTFRWQRICSLNHTINWSKFASNFLIIHRKFYADLLVLYMSNHELRNQNVV